MNQINKLFANQTIKEFHIEDVSDLSEESPKPLPKQTSKKFDEDQHPFSNHTKAQMQINSCFATNFFNYTSKGGAAKRKLPKMGQADFLSKYDENFDDVFGDKPATAQKPESPKMNSQSRKKQRASDEEESKQPQQKKKKSKSKKRDSIQPARSHSRQEPVLPREPKERGRPSRGGKRKSKGTPKSNKQSEESQNELENNNYPLRSNKYDPNNLHIPHSRPRVITKKDKKQEKAGVAVFTFGLNMGSGDSDDDAKQKKKKLSQVEKRKSQSVNKSQPRKGESEEEEIDEFRESHKRKPPKEQKELQPKENSKPVSKEPSQERKSQAQTKPSKRKERKDKKSTKEERSSDRTDSTKHKTEEFLDLDQVKLNKHLPLCKPNLYLDYDPYADKRRG